jgi:predicted PurR-regulated permease PerM
MIQPNEIYQFTPLNTMPLNTHKTMSYLKYLQIVFFSAVILYFGKTLLIPLSFGLLIAMIMYPICRWLEMKGWSRPLAITACLAIVTILFSILLAILIWQLKVFSKDAPVILNKLEDVLQQFQTWLAATFGITANIQNSWDENLSGSLGSIIKSTVQNIVATIFMLFLTPVFTVLFMYHRKIFVQFLKSITPAKYQQQLDHILQQTIHTYFNYIKGMIMVYLIVGILNSIGLFALGVKHPILFGMLCAIMTIIPYLGTIISSVLPISMAWMQTGNIWYPLGVIAVFAFVQYLEANVIYPKVVGTQLHVSTLAMLIAMISGSIIMGIAGMVLFIPFVAILKIVSDNIEEWKPLNLLLSRK